MTASRTIAFAPYAILRDFDLSVSRSVYGETVEEPEHRHDFQELVLIAGGRGVHLFDGERFEISAGDVFFIRSGQSHAYCNMESLELYTILFFDRILEPFRNEFEALAGYHLLFHLEPNMASERRVTGSLCLPPEILPHAVDAAHGLLQTLRASRPGVRIEARCAFVELLLAIVRNCRIRSESGPGYHRAAEVSRILSYLEQNFARPLALETLAARFNMSVGNFRRVFHDATGIAPMRYILRLRLDKAAALLAVRDDPLSRIAAEVGFNDSNYFSHQFRRRFGVAPLRYRKRRASMSK